MSGPSAWRRCCRPAHCGVQRPDRFSRQRGPQRRRDILLAHSRDYLWRVKREVAEAARPAQHRRHRPVSRFPGEALAAAGAVVAAVDAVLGGGARNAFCARRPPGHRASADRGMGFCVFN
ncbi:MAG: hypothetical protein MZW92_24395 [Comamonadaceae bacterium]|nr:hypothetical protein [Comamonadaceae bacterium]